MAWQAIIWTNAHPIHWRIYAALGGDELTLWLVQAEVKPSPEQGPAAQLTLLVKVYK